MAKQTIGIGTTAGDGTGDGLRTAGGKINDNFTEVYDGLGTKIGYDGIYWIVKQQPLQEM